MANYLVLCVSSSKKLVADKWFESAKEKDSDLVELSYVNGNACYYYANQGKLDLTSAGGIFKGYAVDHERKQIIYSGSGEKPNVHRSLPGCYIRIHKDFDDFVIGNDLFAQLPILYFKEDGIVAVSDSVFLLTEIRRLYGLSNRINTDAALSRAWIHGMGTQPLGTNTLIDQISYAPPGTKIRICLSGTKPTAQVEKILVPDLFFNSVTDYRETLLMGAQRIANVVATMALIPETHTTIAVSGGTDSRIGLAAALMQPNPRVYSYATNPIYPDDYAAAQGLAKKFNFEFGKAKSLKSQFKGQIPSWFLSSAGINDRLHAPASTPLEVGFLVGGHGAEVYKGYYRWRPMSAMTPDKVGHVAQIQRRKDQLDSVMGLKEPNIIKNIKKFLGMSKPRVGVDISEAAYHEASKGLHSVGICPENPWASEWHYLCFRNAIDAGRSTMSSLFAVSPILQHELVGLSYSSLNPYPAAVDGSSSVATDLLIALSPDLAVMPFDDPRKNMTESYVKERSGVLGRVNQAEPYSVIGNPKEVHSGTPAFFLQLIDSRGFEGNFSPEAVKKLAIEGFDLVPKEIKHAYELHNFLVENELPERIAGSSWHCNAAAKLMAFHLTK